MTRRGVGPAAAIALVLALASCAAPPPDDEPAGSDGSSSPIAPADGDGADLLVEVPADDGGVVRPHEWHLTGVSPDERIMHVTTSFGGVASDCNRWDRWEVAELDDRVVIAARLWQDPDAVVCTDEGHQRDRYIQLDEPLGDRELIGCQHDDCRTGPLDHSAPGGAVDAADGVLVAWSPAGRFSLDPSDGAVRWQDAGPGAGAWSAAHGMVLRHDGMETTSGLDPADGTEVWSVTGTLLDAVDDLALTCRSEEDGGRTRRFTEAHELDSGATRWSVEIGCGHTVGTDGGLVVVAGWRGEGGASEVAALDQADGTERWRTELRSGGFDLAVAEGRVLVGGGDGILAVDLSDGSVTQLDVAARSPFGAADGTVFATGVGEVVAFGAGDGSVRWTEPFGELESGPPTVVSGGAVFVTDGAAGVIERRDPKDGEVLWRAEVGRSGRIGVAVHADAAYVATSVAVVALDLDTGEQHWWAPIAGG